jgi:peptidoglycan/LPS O-acetylase OafA/YrhL
LAEPIAEATIAVTMSLRLAGWFARRWNYHEPLARSLGRASFAAYVLHAPVVVSLSAILSSVAIVAELKFVVVAVLGVAVSFAVGWLLTRFGPRGAPALISRRAVDVPFLARADRELQHPQPVDRSGGSWVTRTPLPATRVSGTRGFRRDR